MSSVVEPVETDFVARLGSRASVPAEVGSSWGVGEYVDLLVRGGLEDELAAAADRARELRRLDRDRLLALITAMARPPSAELNKSRLSAAAKIPATTVTPYIDVLERVGLIRLVPGTTSLVAKRAVARPRVVFAEAAMARHLAGASADRLASMGGRGRLTPYLLGVVASELLRQRVSSSVDYRVTHLRERNGLAVDLLVELPDDTVYAIEVRTAASFRPHQFRSLEALQDRAGYRFRGGIVLNTAPVGFRYRNRMWGLPISALWAWD